ncbi:MAG: tRNA lysidine(34) synthetase TilS [Treponema sp.]|jgi:tRNA(Ile)-lysidine synthase|nr:tRNA lysidine(34) synthetase TilS [Treponema sp.]
MHPFESAILSALGPLKGGTVLLAAVSGGADSTAMLAALADLREAGGFTLFCIHVEHGIRPAKESKGDARVVESLCASFGVPCRVVSVPPGRVAERARRLNTGIEAAARYYRRRAWEREARRIGAVAVLTAHTRNDCRETALMRLLRGSGPAGLARMPPVRGIVRRPLIDLSRADVISYLEVRGIPWRIDSSNGDSRYFRNRVRNRLVPFLEEQFPGWGKSLDALGETQALAAAFIAGEARRRVIWEALPAKAPEEGPGLRTGAENFFSQPEILREEALFQGINRLREELLPGPGEGGIPRRRSLRLFCQAAPLETRLGLDLGFCRLRREGGFLVITGVLAGLRGKKRVEEAGFSLLIKEPGEYKLNLCPYPGIWPGECTLAVYPSSSERGRVEGDGFTVSLPLVLRLAWGDDVIVTGPGRRLSRKDIREALPGSDRSAPLGAVLDRRGLAAFIGFSAGKAVILGRRAVPGRAGQGSIPAGAALNTGDFFLSIGGIDV